MNQKLWGNNTVYVDFAKEKRSDSGGQPAQGAGGPTDDLTPPSSTLFVANLPLDIDRGALYEIFARFGAILDVRILTDKATGFPKGVAFVDYSLPESAIAAKDELNGYPYLGKSLRVTYASNPTSKKVC